MTACMPALKTGFLRIVPRPVEEYEHHWRSVTDVDMLPPPSDPPAPPVPMPAGCTLRDFFAAFALAGLIAMPRFVRVGDLEHTTDLTEDEAADCAYAHADAMLRKRREPPQVMH